MVTKESQANNVVLYIFNTSQIKTAYKRL